MKRLKMVVALAMAMTMVFGSAMSVSAADVTVDTDSTSGSCDSQFEVDSSMLGGNLVVSIPADLNLAYDAGTQTFAKDDYVTVKGSIAATKKVDISVVEENTWTIQETMAVPLTASGTVVIGTDPAANKTVGNVTADMTTITYSATEVRQSNVTPDQRPVKASVALADVPTIGTYKTAINFFIEVKDI